MLQRYAEAGLDVEPQIVVVTRLIPDSEVPPAHGRPGSACQLCL